MVAATCWIPAAQLEETARLIWHARPVSYYAWSGHEHHANTTETARAMALLYALTGSLRRRRRQCAVPRGPLRPDHRGGPARREAPCPRDRPRGPAARSGAVEQRLRPGFLPRGAGRHALPHAGSDRVRVQYPAGLLRPGAGSAGARGAGLPCPCRSVHEPHRRVGRYRAAGRIILRARGAARSASRSARRRNPSCSSARPSCRRPGRRGPTPTSSSISPCGSAWETNSGAAISRPPIATSWGRAA